MPKRKKSGGTNRTVVYLSDANRITVFAVLTPPGESGPPFGATSKFINELLDDWRARRAIQENQQ